MKPELPWDTASAEEIERDLHEAAARVYEMGTSPILFDQLHPENEPKRPCPRGVEECDGWAYEEMDGTLAFWACDKCGYEFGYEQTGGDDGYGDHCQLGIPEDIRRIASEPAEKAQRPKMIPLNVRSKP